MSKSNSINLEHNPIYKVNYLINDSIDTIYVFYGIKDSSDENELFKKTFTEDEIKNIREKNIKVKFLEQQINFDDTIGMIKIKILKELQNVSIDELYLFCEKIEILNAVSVYQSLTQNKKIPLTQIRLEQFVSNIVSDENNEKLDFTLSNEVYDFEDILKMRLHDKKYKVNKVLGQKFFIVENEYPFVVNPYKVDSYDSFFEKVSRKSLSTLNNQLLLNNGSIVDNNIYLCLAKDVLNYVLKKDVSQENTIKIYYPFLYNSNINTLEDLNDSEDKLLESNKKYLNDKTYDLFKTINMFYNIYYLKKSELKYVNKGIKYIKACIKPEFNFKIPLEIIFKIVHSTDLYPLIKFNPSSRQENIYRLYTDKISVDGRKIPYLKRASIFKLMKTIARNKSVAVYIEHKKDDVVQTVVCEFDENGYITITSEFEKVINVFEIDTFFQELLNPIIQEITNLLQQSGYKLEKFNSLNDENIEIKQLTYESQIEISKPINLDTYKGCISSIFNNESTDFNSGIHLRFKKVANFNKVTSQEAFILEKSEQGLRGDEIIEALLENFKDDLTEKNAIDLVKKVANEIQLERGVRKSDIKIKDNPGFKTTIELNKSTSIITIVVENINDIHYLSTIPIYLDTVIRLTQDKKNTKYPTKEINKLCGSGEKTEVKIVDIISLSENAISENEIPSIDEEDESIEYTKYSDSLNVDDEDKPKGAFSLFYNEESEEESEEESQEESQEESLEGGANSTGSSILSEKTNEETSEQIESPIELEEDISLKSFTQESSDDIKEIKEINESEKEQEKEKEKEQEKEEKEEEKEKEKERIRERKRKIREIEREKER